MITQNPKSLIPWLAILVAVLAWFSPWWIGGMNLAPLDLQNLMMSPWRDGNVTDFAKNHIVSDGVDQYLVYRMVAAESYAKEGWLGWSALTYGGTAQYANTMALYYDWTMQLHRWFSFWTAWHLGLLGQVLLAAFGMFAFLRGRSIASIWSCCGALAYAANSQFVTWTYHRWALGAFCWVPWILWAIDRYRGGKSDGWALVPAFIAMAFMGGTLQHAVLVILAVAAIWLEESFQTGFQMKPQLRLLGRYAAWGILASGLAGMMFVPCINAFIESNRLGLHHGMTTNAENSVYPAGPLQPLFNLAAYPFQVFPSVLGRSDSLDALKLFKSDLFYIAYFGSLPVLIAFLALWKKTTPLLARVLIGLGLLLPLTPLVRLLYQRIFLLFIMGGILAFAHFMATSTREARLSLFKFFSIIVGVAIAGWTVLSVILHLNPEILSQLHSAIATQGAGSSFGFFRDWISQRAGRFIGDLFIWSPQQLIPLLLLAAGLVGLFWTASAREGLRHKGALLVTLAVLGEVSLFGSRWVVWSDPAEYPLFPETVESEALRKYVGSEGRTTTLIHPTGHMAMTPFIPNTLSVYHIASISGYDSIIPDGMILPSDTPADADRLGRLAVGHLITWSGNPDVPDEWQKIWTSPSMTLYQNPMAIPRYAGFREESDIDSFFSGLKPDISKLDETSGLENQRIIQVPRGIRWIRIAENQAAGWQYRHSASAEWKAVERAPDASMLIENPEPAFPTRIEMRYDPPLRKIGFLMSSASLLLLIGVGIKVKANPTSL